MVKTFCVEYDEHWLQKLKHAHQLSAEELIELHHAYGQYIGEQINGFLSNHSGKVDFVSSHGHTVFHNPQQHISLQIGHGAYIANTCKLPVVCDFRTGDIALQGQGAPLVPIGDQLLFGDYDACLNLGGFANISFQQNRQSIAFDICPVNIVLNALMQPLGKAYDHNGSTAAGGNVHPKLLAELNQLEYYHQTPPKSLGREWVAEHISPILAVDLPTKDILATFTLHAAQQITSVINANQIKSILITGGGAHNKHLITLLQQNSNAQIITADPQLIDYKEALIFALLGLLRILGLPNTLPSVTGATKPLSSGAIYLPTDYTQL